MFEYGIDSGFKIVPNDPDEKYFGISFNQLIEDAIAAWKARKG
jgi:hypothetical protein